MRSASLLLSCILLCPCLVYGIIQSNYSMVYHDAYEIYELLDAWNHQGPPKAELVQELFQRDATAAQQIFAASGKTLLHKCLEYYSHELVLVKLFCEYHTAALTTRDALLEQVPLHMAVQPPSREAKLAVVQYLVEQAPETVFMPNRQGQLPLHMAATAGNASVVKYLLSLFPEAAQWRDKAQQFPIDHALVAVQCPNVDIVQLLLQPFPTVLSFYDESGSLRLHRLLACRCDDQNPTHAKLLQVILDAFPAALSLQDLYTHQTPLFQACIEDNPLSQIYTLLRQWPEQISPQRKHLIWNNAAFNGELVAAGLVSKHMTIDRVRQWYDHHQSATKILTKRIPPDVTGRLPLHYAVCSEASSDQVLAMTELLLEQDESAVQHQDVYGRLPLHYAVMSPQQDEHVVTKIIQTLMDAHPAGLVVRDKEGRMPWHYGEAVRLPISLLDATHERFSNVLEEDWELVPEEVHWDIGRILLEDVV